MNEDQLIVAIWLPWYVMILASLVDMARNALRIYNGVSPWRSMWSIVSLALLIAVWCMFIVTSGPHPIAERAQLAWYIRVCAFVGGSIWLTTGIIELATSSNFYQSFRIRREEKSNGNRTAGVSHR